MATIPQISLVTAIRAIKYTFNAEYAFSRIDTLIGYNLIYFASKNTVSASNDKSDKIPSYAVSDIYATYAPSSWLNLKG